MMRIEQIMSWRWADEADCWVDHLGQYRDEVTVDDILSWFSHNGYIMVEGYQNPMEKKFVVSFSGTSKSLVAQGSTFLSALTSAVASLHG